MTGLIPSRGTNPGNNDSGGNRSSEEKIYAILSIAQNKGATKMQIMAKAFISHETATGCLEKLKQQGLIDYNAGTGVYLITEKGRQRIIEYANV